MTADVFVSYSSKDKPQGDAVCHVLESRGIKCWIAPRDIEPGGDWAESIIEAIGRVRCMVLVFSSHANSSPQIRREVERAIHKSVPIIPVRIENVEPSAALEYYLSTPHWLDAFTPPLEAHLDRLAQTVGRLLGNASDEERPPRASAPPSAGRIRNPLRAPHHFLIGAALVGALLVGAAVYFRAPEIRALDAERTSSTGVQYDQAKLRRRAAELQIPLPPEIPTPSLPAAAPPDLARHLGAWSSSEGWNGRGRQLIIIVFKVDGSGSANGVYATGRPTEVTYTQNPPTYVSFDGKLDGNVLTFDAYAFHYKFTFQQNGVLTGHFEGTPPSTGKEMHGDIILQRIE